MAPPPRSIVTISTPEEARALGAHLMDRARTRPVCVVSIADDAPGPFIDIEEVARELGEVCDYYLIPTGRLTYLLSDELPEAAGVFGGAGRMYGPAEEWVDNPFTGSRLVMCREADRGPAATDSLIELGLHFGRTSASSKVPASKAATFTVKQLIPPSRALATSEDGHFASLWAESLVRGVDIESLVQPGQQIAGWVVPGAGRIELADAPRRGPQMLGEYVEGLVVLVRVAEVLADRANVELVPGLRAMLHRDDVTGNPIDRMTSLVSEGEVLAARVLRVGVPGGKGWRLGTLDVDDDEPIVAAPALLPGGPPWLRPEQIGVAFGGAPEPPGATAPPGVVPKPAPPPGVRVAPSTSPKPVAETPPKPPAPATPEFVVPKPGPPGAGRAAPAQAAPAAQAQTAPAPVAPAQPAPAAEPVTPRVVLPADDSPLMLRLKEAEGNITALQLLVERLRLDQVRLHNRLRKITDGAQSAQGGTGIASDEEIEALRQQRGDLERAAAALDAENEQLRQERAAQRSEVRRAKQEATRARRAQRESTQAPTVFSHPEEQFRWEVEQAWAVRIPAAEKASLPLQEYVVLPGFLESLAETDGIDRSKVVDVVVDIATGRIHDIPARETHQLREGDKGAPARTRADGATCWRVSLQVKTPSARRLHFWQPPGRPPELSSVRLHDDFRP